jgi:hypothetical protein
VAVDRRHAPVYRRADPDDPDDLDDLDDPDDPDDPDDGEVELADFGLALPRARAGSPAGSTAESTAG